MDALQHELVCQTRQTVPVNLLKSNFMHFTELFSSCFQFFCRLAIGSFVEEYNNKVQVISLDEDSAEFVPKSTFDHPYPTTKIMWIPDGV